MITKITTYVGLLILISCKSNERGTKIKRVNVNKRTVEAYYIDDTVMHGVAKYFALTGYLESKITYKNGIKDGPAINYYPNGGLWDSSYYVNGLKCGSHFVFDSLGRLVYQDFYFNGHRLGGQVFYQNSKLKKYVFSNFEKLQLYEGLYDSVGSLFRYGGEIVNANLYYAQKDGVPGIGVFAYFLNPPNVDIKYTIGLIEDKTDDKKELAVYYKKGEFIDTIMEEPHLGWNYYVAADYNDSINKYHKIFLTVLKKK
jgi:hypothetical protein